MKNKEIESVNDTDDYILTESECTDEISAGAMSRVATAVGEGSMAISFVHKYLGEM